MYYVLNKILHKNINVIRSEMDTCDTKSIVQDGSQQQTNAIEVPIVIEDKQLQGVSAGGDTGVKKKKTRRGKSKRKANKPYAKLPWHQRRNPIGKNSKINRNRKLVLAQAKLHAPYNTNQFLMEVHMPECEGVFQIPKAPSARTRDSSFSVDSEENYFYSLPEDEEDFLTKEFSSVYEIAQSERMANMPREELIGENLVLEAKVESLTKRLSRFEKDDKTAGEDSKTCRIVEELRVKLKEHEDLIRELQASNETLKLQNERLTQQKSSRHSSASVDSESDSSSSSSSSSSQGSFQLITGRPTDRPPLTNGSPMVNGFSHSPSPESPVNGHIDSDEALSNDDVDEVIPVNGNGTHEPEIPSVAEI